MSSQLQEPIQRATLPRLLLGIDPQRALDLDQHLEVHGPPPEAATGGGRRLGRRAGRGALIEELERAGMRGRGGASFSTATKMRAVAAAKGRAIVVVNATEGEPASLKDRLLLQSLPHLVLDGAVLAAKSVGAEEAVVCVCEANADLQSVKAAIAQRLELREGVQLRFSVVPNGYVTGQESALINHLSGGPARPTFTPPMPFESGVNGRPTLVANAETLAHVAMVARRGAQWYRQLGTPGQPGSTLVTLSGPVVHPGVYEIEHGASLSSLIDAAGGLRCNISGVLIGGYAGTWAQGGALHTIALSDEQLAPLGASLGSGVIALLSDQACPIAETARLMSWLADQSAGQCGPCLNGLHAIAATFAEVAVGAGQRDAGERLAQLVSLTRGRGACRHPDGAVRLIESAAQKFPKELADHARHGACEGCHRQPELPLPAWSSRVARQPVARTYATPRLRAAARRQRTRA